MTRSTPFQRLRTAFCLSLAATLLSTIPADAQVFTYIGPNNGSWQNPVAWTPFNPALPPVLNPPPSSGDVAIIQGDRNVLLNADVQDLAGLTIGALGDLFTNGHQLQVINGSGDAELNVVGTGTMGNNTEIFVEPLGTGLIANIINLTNGGEIDLTNGGSVSVHDILNVDGLSIITGEGSIGFNNGPAGRRLDLGGTIRPDSNSQISIGVATGTLDLDGSPVSGGTGHLDLSNTGASLVITSTLTDAFSGFIDMGTDSTLSMSNAWDMHFQGSATPQLNFDAIGGTATVSGGTVTIGANNAIVNANSGIGRFTDDVVLQSNADINIFSGAEIDFDGELTITGSASITGQGVFDAGTQNNVTGNVTIATDTVDFDSGNWDIRALLTLDTDTIDALAGNSFDIWSIDIDSRGGSDNGRLTVNLPGDDAWTLGSSGEMNIVAATGAFASTNVSGSEMRILGTVNVDGNSRISAPIDLRNGGSIALANADSTLTLTNDSRLAGGEITGDGEFRSASAIVSGHGTIDADVRFSSVAELMADNGTLVINGNIDDLGARFGTADDDGVLEVNDSWDAADAGEVRLNGGQLISNGTLRNSGGQIRGHGLVEGYIDNHGTIAAEGGTLEIGSTSNWDGEPVGGNDGDGLLEATAGDLLVSATMIEPNSFVGRIHVGNGRSFTYETGADNDDIRFDDPTGDSDASGDMGRLTMTGGTLVADDVIHEGQFTISNHPSTIEARIVDFSNLSNSVIDSELRLDTSIASQVEANASFSGAGQLVNTENSSLFVQDEAEIGVDLTNEGRLQLGGGPIVAQVVADIEARTFHQTDTGEIVVNIAGTGLDEFDRIAAVDGATLDGTLTASFMNGFAASIGDVFPILSAGGAGVDGTFATENMPVVPVIGADYGLFTRYQATLVELIATFFADFDKDGDVDGADFLIWQDNFGTQLGAVHGDGDADGDGDVDGEDFLTWQTQFGSAVGLGGGAGGMAVPEPTTGSLVLLIGAASLAGRRRQAV